MILHLQHQDQLSTGGAGPGEKIDFLEQPAGPQLRNARDQHRLIDGLARTQRHEPVDRGQGGASRTRQFDVFEDQRARRGQIDRRFRGCVLGRGGRGNQEDQQQDPCANGQAAGWPLPGRRSLRRSVRGLHGFLRSCHDRDKATAVPQWPLHGQEWNCRQSIAL